MEWSNKIHADLFPGVEISTRRSIRVVVAAPHSLEVADQSRGSAARFRRVQGTILSGVSFGIEGRMIPARGRPILVYTVAVTSRSD